MMHVVRCRVAAALLTSACCSVACSDSPEPQLRQRGLAAGEEVPRGPTSLPKPPPPPPVAPPRSSLESPFAAPAPDPGALARSAAAIDEDAGSSVAQIPTGPADTGVQRDLPAELITLVGQPGSCLELDSVTRGGGRLTITLTAYAVPSGRITRATAIAPGQSAAALRCLEQRAVAGSLRGPVPGAPLQITATIPIEVFSQPNPR